MIKRILIILGLWVLVAGFRFDEDSDPLDLSWLPKIDTVVTIDKTVWQKKGDVRTCSISLDLYGALIHFRLMPIERDNSRQSYVGLQVLTDTDFDMKSLTGAYLSVFVITNYGVTNGDFLNWQKWDSQSMFFDYNVRDGKYACLYPRFQYKGTDRDMTEITYGWHWYTFDKDSFRQEFVIYNDIVGYKYRIRFTKEQADKIYKMVKDLWLAEEL